MGGWGCFQFSTRQYKWLPDLLLGTFDMIKPKETPITKTKEKYRINVQLTLTFDLNKASMKYVTRMTLTLALQSYANLF